MALKHETVAKFISKNGGDVYFVKREVATGELSCKCKRWNFFHTCKHVDYVKTNGFIELIDIPTNEEAMRMDWGRNLE